MTFAPIQSTSPWYSQLRFLAVILWAVFSAFTSPGLHAEPGATRELPMVKTVPFEHFNVNRHQRFAELVSNAHQFDTFRRSLVQRMIPIRARFDPKPPLDPRFPKYLHGVAFALGNSPTRWVTAGPLVKGADRIESHNGDGDWYEVIARLPCPDAELATLDQVRRDKATKRVRKDPIGPDFGLNAAAPQDVKPHRPLLALSNLEGTAAVLDVGRIDSVEKEANSTVWISNLKLAPGTPLVNAEGAVLLVRIKRGTRSYELPPSALDSCPEKPSDENPDEPKGP